MGRVLGAIRRRWRNAVVHLLLCAVAALMLLPVAATVLVSFKQEQDVLRRPPVWFPCDTATRGFDPGACRWSTESYTRVLAPRAVDGWPPVRLAGSLLRLYMPNTLLYATASALLVVLLAGLAGYALARYRFPGRRLLMSGILATTGIPLLTNLLALYQMGIDLRRTQLPLADDRVFIVLVYVGFYLPLSVWIAKSFFDTIPRELEEAAFIDGCSPLGALARITMPLAMPGLLTIFLLTFVNVWNEFIAGYLLLARNALKPVMFGLYEFMSQNIINYQVLAAACVLIALPVIVLFLLARRRFFGAVLDGAMRG